METLYTIMIAFLLVCIGVVNALPQGRKASPFWCRKCKGAMERTLSEGYFPTEVLEFLYKHNLPKQVISRYVCRKGHTQLWFVPKLGHTDKSLFVVRDL